MKTWNYNSPPKGALNKQTRADGEQLWLVVKQMSPSIELVSDGKGRIGLEGSFYFENYWDAYAYWLQCMKERKDGRVD